MTGWGDDPEYKELVQAYGISVVMKMEDLGVDLHEAYLVMKEGKEVGGNQEELEWL